MLVSCLLVACRDSKSSEAGQSAMKRDSADLAFAGVQDRGHAVMGVNQYTSTHQFEPLPDGGRIRLERDPRDTLGVARIRRHMRDVASAFGQGNFTLPGFVHAREVPGTAQMRARRSRISYIPADLPAGGQLRIVSQDSLAIAAIHEFLAFQRHDHRTDSHNHAGQ
jgi:hypothetical protein